MSKAAMTALPYTGVFNPTSIAGCKLWLDAADSASFTFSSGSNISLWKDKSGLGNNFTTVTGTNTRIADGGYSVVSFSTGNYMTSANQVILTTSSALFIVSKVLNTGFNIILACTNIVSGGNAGDFSIRIIGGVLYNNDDDIGNQTYYVNGTFNPSFDSSTYVNTYSIIGTLAPGKSGTTYLTFSSPFYSSRYLNGNIAEFLFYPDGVTSSQRQQIEGYLAAKWGLQASLPSFLGPTTISGCTLWLDGADSSTFTKSGSSITQWRDKSTSANHCIQATLANAPIVGTAPNGLTSVLFATSTSQMLSLNNIAFTGASIRTVIYVLYLPVTGNKIVTGFGAATANNSYVVSIAAVPGDNIYYPSFYNNDILLNTFANSSILVGVPCIVYTYYDGTTMGGYINSANNQTRTTTPATTSSQLYLGSRSDGYSSLNGHIFEAIHYNVILTTTQRQQIEGYLSVKWGLQANLPPSHPYYSSSPTHPYATTAPVGPSQRPAAVTALVPIVKKAMTASSYNAVFNPTSIAGCQLWLDAADTASTTMSGNNITVWKDKSGNGYNATAVGTVGMSMINSFRAVAFTGGSVTGYFTGNLPYTGPTLSIFSVSMLVSQVGYRIFSFGLAGATDYSAPGYGFFAGFYASDSNSGFQGYKNTSDSAKSSLITLGTPYITSLIWDGTNSKINLNGGSINSLAQSGGGFTISNYAVGIDVVASALDPAVWSGNIGELIVYSTALTTIQRQQIEGYLAAKWGLQGNLPPFAGPTSIPGCKLWLDGSDPAGTGVVPANGSVVTTWADKSGNGHNATGVNSPILVTNAVNSLSAVSYNDTNYSFSSIASNTFSSAMFVFFIYKVNSAAAYCVPWSRTVGNAANVFDQYNTARLFDAGYLYIFSSWNLASATTPTLLSQLLVNSPTTTYAEYLNGSTTAAGTFTMSRAGVDTATRVYIATRDDKYTTFNGYICEIIMYNTQLTLTQQKQVEGYLARKWGTQASLPTTHPYYSSSPTHPYATTTPTGASLRAPAVAALVPIPKKGTTAIKKIGFLPYYQVDSTSWSTDWQPYLQGLVAANSTGVVTVTASNLTGGASYVGGGWRGGILAPDGCIYFAPHNASNILKLNVSTGVTTNITGGASFTSSGWYGGVLGPDGCIYFAPHNAANILKLNVATGVTTNITGGASYTSSGWYGGVLGPDGNIYFAPHGAANILKLTVSTGVTTNITGGASFVGGSERCTSGVLGPDGNIYFMPYGATNFIKLTVATGVTTNITGGANFAGAWAGGAIAPDGNIYTCAPFYATSFIKLNISTGITTNISGSASYVAGGWRGGVLGPDGNIYSIPHGIGNILKLNVTTGATTNITGGSASYESNGWTCGVLAPDGNIYCGPQNASNILKISFTGLKQLPSLNFCLSAYVNKI